MSCVHSLCDGAAPQWLAKNPQSQALSIITTPNQDPVALTGLVPLLGIDVWEHAYYLQVSTVLGFNGKLDWSSKEQGAICIHADHLCFFLLPSFQFCRVLMESISCCLCVQYKNARPAYLTNVWKVVNWADVASRYENS